MLKKKRNDSRDGDNRRVTGASRLHPLCHYATLLWLMRPSRNYFSAQESRRFSVDSGRDLIKNLKYKNQF